MVSIRSLFIACLAILCCVIAPGCGKPRKQADGEAQVRRWAEKLASQTTETGRFIRWDTQKLPENDPWGNPLAVSYERGGLAETLTVRSLGPDGQPHTDDDIVAANTNVTMAGVGHGIKNNLEETSAKAGKGLVRGIIQGVQEELKAKE